jgi:hypothetical protein
VNSKTMMAKREMTVKSSDGAKETVQKRRRQQTTETNDGNRRRCKRDDGKRDGAKETTANETGCCRHGSISTFWFGLSDADCCC